MSRDWLDERFGGGALDESVWFPYYLPHWSSRAGSAAAYEISDGELRLSIPDDHPLWCPDLHPAPLRVSCLQTGSFAGRLGSLAGQQPFRDGLVVREEQPLFRGFTPTYGRIGVQMRAQVSPRSMFAFWLSGFEDEPERSGEICVAEIFGDAIADGVAQVGMGVHRFRDPRLEEEFATAPLRLDPAEPHRYEVDWTPDGLRFLVDGSEIRRSGQSPDYPVQLMLGVFDFPDKATSESAGPPVLMVDRVWGQPHRPDGDSSKPEPG